MAKKKPLLEQMRANPRKDWTIQDVERLCNEHGLTLETPSSGSHYEAVSPIIFVHQTIPRARPIKPVYIKMLVRLVDAHYRAMAERAGEESK